MSMDPAAEPGPTLRASDAEREAVVQRLNAACTEGRITPEELTERCAAAYAARTRAELEPLTRDLPASGGPRVSLGKQPVPAPATEAAPPIVAVFAGTERRGHWRPARRETAVAVFGGVVLDLRDAELPPDVIELRAYAVFGGVEIQVPDGVRVEMTGFSVFGGREVRTAGGAPESAGPVLRLHAVAVFGGVSVKGRRRPWWNPRR